MEDKLKNTIALLEKVSGRKVTLVEAKAEVSKKEKEAEEKEEAKAKKETKKESVVTEAKIEMAKETPKEKKVDKAITKAADVAPANIEKTAAGIIPPSAIQTIQVFMDETLADIEEGVIELQSMKIDANTIASGDDYYQKAEELQNSIKQIARMSTFVKNTIIAKKFDANLLDKIISYKNHQAIAAAPAIAPAAPVTPIVPEVPVI